MPATTIKTGIEEFNNQSRKLMELINKLRDMGAHFDLKIPGIIVCGNQSAGKSSVIEAITKVPLPRADGTCTRCPIEVRMSEKAGSQWQCHVSIRKEFDAKGDRLAKPVELKFGEKILKFKSVASRIERAQVAVVNPSKSVEEVLHADNLNAIENEIKFSENVVCVSIVGPSVGNLTLVDLPGLIQATSAKEEERYIVMIENLVKKYAKNDRNVIVECITCKDDIENQKVYTLARDFDPDGVRTIGVLTKIDTIEEGCHSKWIEVLNGNTHFLNHGYFAVRNPSKSELDAKISFAEARDLEQQCFKEYPWNECTVDSSKYGINHLKTYLSKILSELINKSLPEIEKEIMKKLADNKDKLNKLPKAVESPMTEFSTKMSRLAQDIAAIIENQVDLGLWHKEKRHYLDFQDAINNSLPYYEEFDDDAIKSLPEDNNKQIITFDKVKEMIEYNLGRQVSGIPNVEVAVSIKNDVVDQWESPFFSCLFKVAEELRKHCNEVMAKQLGDYAHLHSYATRCLNTLLNELKEKCEQNLLDQHFLDCRMMFSLNLKDMQKNRTEYMEAWKQKKQESVNNDEEWIKNAFEGLKQEHSFKDARNSKNFKELVDHQKVDPKDLEAAELMAYSKAYFEITAKRVVDNVAMLIESKLVMDFSKHLKEKVFEWIQVPKEKLNVLIQQDQSIINKRQLLVMEKDRLEAAYAEIQE